MPIRFLRTSIKIKFILPFELCINSVDLEYLLQALKYVSFPVQTLAKCAKMIPVMVRHSWPWLLFPISSFFPIYYYFHSAGVMNCCCFIRRYSFSFFLLLLPHFSFSSQIKIYTSWCISPASLSCDGCLHCQAMDNRF